MLLWWRLILFQRTCWWPHVWDHGRGDQWYLLFFRVRSINLLEKLLWLGIHNHLVTASPKIVSSLLFNCWLTLGTVKNNYSFNLKKFGDVTWHWSWRLKIKIFPVIVYILLHEPKTVLWSNGKIFFWQSHGNSGMIIKACFGI